MTPVTRHDIVDFAERVERLCEFFLSKAEKNASNDITIIQKIKEDAAAVQLINVDTSDETNKVIEGLSDFMRGAPVT